MHSYLSEMQGILHFLKGANESEPSRTSQGQYLYVISSLFSRQS